MTPALSRRIGAAILSVVIGAAGAAALPRADAAVITDTGSGFVSMAPTRVLDSRVVGAGAITFGIDIPAEATAAVINLTVSGVTANTYLSLCREELSCQDTSVLNAAPGRDVANLTIPALGGSRKLKLYNNAGSVIVSADLVGYFSPLASGGRLLPVGPQRDEEKVTLSGGASSEITLDDVPPGASAAALRVTASGVVGNTYVTACPTLQPLTDCRRTSTLNSRSRDTSNLTFVNLDGGNRVRLYNNSGSATVTIDLLGYFVPDGAVYHAVDPVRVESDRRLFDRDDITENYGELPSGATAVVANLTAAASSETTYVSLCPESLPLAACQTTSSLNPYPGSDVAGLGLSPYGNGLRYYNNRGSALLFTDLQGYFAASQPPATTYRGTGTDVIRLSAAVSDPRLVTFTYSGPEGNQVVWAVDSAGKKTDLLVNEVSAGFALRSAFGLSSYTEAVAGFEITVPAGGIWTMDVGPISDAPRWEGTGTYTGSGPEIVIVAGAFAPLDSIRAAANGTSNFVVWSYGNEGRDLLFNEIAPTSGQAFVPAGTQLLEVGAEGAWTLSKG